MDENKLAELVPYSQKISQMEAMLKFMVEAPIVRMTVLQPSDDPEKALQFSVQLTTTEIALAKSVAEIELNKQIDQLRDYLAKAGVVLKPTKAAARKPKQQPKPKVQRKLTGVPAKPAVKRKTH